MYSTLCDTSCFIFYIYIPPSLYFRFHNSSIHLGGIYASVFATNLFASTCPTTKHITHKMHVHINVDSYKIGVHSLTYAPQPSSLHLLTWTFKTELWPPKHPVMAHDKEESLDICGWSPHFEFGLDHLAIGTSSERTKQVPRRVGGGAWEAMQRAKEKRIGCEWGVDGVITFLKESRSFRQRREILKFSNFFEYKWTYELEDVMQFWKLVVSK